MIQHLLILESALATLRLLNNLKVFKFANMPLAVQCLSDCDLRVTGCNFSIRVSLGIIRYTYYTIALSDSESV